MPESRESEILFSAAQQVLETMFFTSIMGDRDTPPGDPAIDVRVAFHGSPSGILGMRLSACAARAIATNFLGTEDDSEVTEAQITEVVRELANMVCGAVLSQLEAGSTFDISGPELHPCCGEGAVVRSLELDTGAITLGLTLQRN
jgi:CheY-specific phosphatase CheX